MKFSGHLASHITPEWRKQYINYEEMKAMIYQAVEEAPAVDSVEEDILKRHFANFDESFFNYCDKELKKINTFYAEKLAEATRKFATLNNELKIAMDGVQHKGKGKPHQVLKKKSLPYKKIQEFKLAFSEFYLSLILLQNYQSLNHTGFRKILKKHDKLLRVDIGGKWQKEKVETSHFFVNRDIDKLIHDTEHVVTSDLEEGDRQKAMKRLRVPPLGEQQSLWTTFKVGLFSGSFIVLFIAVILSTIFYYDPSNSADILGRADTLKLAFRLYRAPFLIVLFVFLIAINIYGWRSAGCNHVLIFELDPRNHLSEQHLMELAGIFGVVWSISVLTFLYSQSLSIPPFVNPLALVFVMIAFMCNPFKVFRWEARFWMLRTIGRMIAAPFFAVKFADFWLADQLNSLVIALMDFYFLLWFYFTSTDWIHMSSTATSTAFDLTRPIVNCLPAWFRFAQCLRRYRDSREAFPHLVNAGKYSTTFFAVTFAALRAYNAPNYASTFDNPFTYPMIASQFVSSCYALTWDLKMDWGLFDRNAGENTFLREEIVYSSASYYYFAIIENTCLRFIWIPSFIITENRLVGQEVLVTVLATLEVFRRFVWNFFRLENEHLNNCGQFRAVRDISIAPIDSSDQTTILKMMDDPDGVINRYTKQNRPKMKKTKDIEKKQLLTPYQRASIPDLSIDLQSLKRL